MGLTPADVDLRRMLSLVDPATNYSILQLAGLSPSNFHKPTLTSNNDLIDTDYKWYRSFIDPSSPVDQKRIEPSTNAISVGRYAYNAIKLGIEFGGTLDERYYAWPPEVRETNSTPPAPIDPASAFNDQFNPPNIDTDVNAPYRLRQYYTDPFDGTGVVLTAPTRRRAYYETGVLNPFNSEINGSSNSVGELYGQDDLLELLTFHGLNDPYSMTRLEKNALGRMPSIFGQNQRAFSPLLSNRPLDLDRYRHGYSDQYQYGIAAANEPREIAGQIAKESMSFFAVTPRRLLTTVSGSAAIVPNSYVGNPLIPSLDDSEAAPTLGAAIGSPTSLFNVYSNALAGELNASKFGVDPANAFLVDPANRRTDGTAGPISTLFYGHYGPELALRIAAHSAVNMADLYDSDQIPSAATLIVDDSARDDLITNYDGEDARDPEYVNYAGRAMNNMFDPGNTPDSQFSGAQEGRKAVNVFGIEPMPILTEMSSMYVYTDSPGGEDFNPADPSRRGPLTIIPSPNVPVDIDDGVTAANDDFMLQVLAFQLTNPWDVAIQIGGSSVNEPMGYIDDSVNEYNKNLQFDYYIEFGGRFFKLGEFVEYNPGPAPYFDPANYPENPPPHQLPEGAPITSSDEEYQYRSVVIPANSSRVFYAIAHSRFEGYDDRRGV